MQEPLLAFIRAHSSMSEAMQATVAAHFKPAELAAGEHLLKAEAERSSDVHADVKTWIDSVAPDAAQPSARPQPA